jgi:ABC-type sugar transport system ATPase subunit
MSNQGICIRGLKKSYDGNVVVNIDELDLLPGNVYGLIGTNGSGKTTLMKAIVGSVRYEEGIISSGDLEMQMIYHEAGLFQELTVAENMFMNRELYRKLGPIQWINYRHMYHQTTLILNKYFLEIDVKSKVKKLNLATQKILEIVIALSKNPQVLIIDEPLALMDHEQVDMVQRLLKGFMTKDKIILYISHRMDELVSLANEVITLKNGHVVKKQKVTDNDYTTLWEFSEKDINRFPKRKIKQGKQLLRLEHFKTEHLRDINLSLNEGQIIGVVGLKGSYKSELGNGVFGAIPYDGKIFLYGKEIKLKTTAHAVEHGICYIGSSQESTFIEESIYENVVSANGRRARRLSYSAKKLIAKYYLEMMNVKTSNITNAMDSMSAGNKQKILLAKWFFSRSKVFIFNRPTSNIDLPSRVDIYNIFSDLLESKAGILIISNDLEEIAGICDQVIVIKDGRIADVLMDKRLSVNNMVTSLQNWTITQQK